MLSKEMIDFLSTLSLEHATSVLMSNTLAVEAKNKGFIDMHPTAPATEDKVPVIITDLGVSHLPSPETSGETEFEIENVPLPAKKCKGGRQKDIYPWEDMEIGNSFHVAKTAKLENPSKKMNSSVSSANKRFAGERRFSVRSVDETDSKGVGVRVFRIE